MKKILFWAVILTASISSQWQQQLPTPYGKILLDINLVENNNIFLSSFGAFIKSSNNGEDWLILRNINGINDIWYSVFFINSYVGWMTSNGKIIKTTDGGINWVEQNPNSSDQIYKIQFFDEQNGVAITGQEKRVLTTANGGNNWVVKSVPSTNFLECGFFINSSVGWVSGQNEILKTTNSGDSWNTYNLTSLFFDCFFINENTGWFVGGNGHIVKTTDSGLSWNNQVSNTSYDLKSIYMINENVGWAAGFNGTIIKTTDGGANWNVISTPTIENLLSIKFKDQNIGWAVGSNGVVLQSTDGGFNWILMSRTLNSNLTNGFFINSEIGWLTSTSGLIFKSSDSGKSWLSSALPTSSALYDIEFTNLNSGWAVGNNGNILASTDGGIIWNIQSSGTNNRLNSVCLASTDTGYAVGLNGTLLKTTNRGGEWINNNRPSSNQLIKIIKDENKHLWIAGYDNFSLLPLLLKSDDGGINWSNKFFTDSVALYALAKTNNDFIIGGAKAVPGGNKIVVFRSTNNGDDWLQIFNAPAISSGSRIVDLQINKNGDYIAITTKKILFSSNNGISWGEEELALENLNSIFSSDSSTYWVTGENSLLLKNLFSGVTDVEKDNSFQPVEYYLSQNYPNPFNPSTKISYSMAVEGFVTLKIYDILGREVSTLINEEKPAGNYEVNLNASSLVSGVYFYQLKAGNFVQSKKMILLR